MNLRRQETFTLRNLVLLCTGRLLQLTFSGSIFVKFVFQRVKYKCLSINMHKIARICSVVSYTHKTYTPNILMVPVLRKKLTVGCVYPFRVFWECWVSCSLFLSCSSGQLEISLPQGTTNRTIWPAITRTLGRVGIIASSELHIGHPC